MKVLIVDDNVDSAEILTMLLQLAGYTTASAHDGPAALARAEELRPDAVLLDIGLPGMDGYEVARRIRRAPGLEGTLLVAVSGYGQERDRMRSREAGFDHHLVKPVDDAVLLALLARWPARS